MKPIYNVCFLLLIVQLGWTQTSALPTLRLKVEKAAAELSTHDTHPMDPLALNAILVWSDDKTQLAVVMKTILEDGWHMYAYVPKTQPFIATELQLELPDGIKAIGDWVQPHSEPYDDGIYIYHGELVFVQYCAVENYDKASKITCGLYYQACDIHKCFPPENKMKNLILE